MIARSLCQDCFFLFPDIFTWQRHSEWVRDASSTCLGVYALWQLLTTRVSLNCQPSCQVGFWLRTLYRSLTRRHGQHRPETLDLFKVAPILNPAAVVLSAIVYWCWHILFAWSFCACQLQLHLNHWIPRWRWRFRTVCLCSNILATQDWPEVEIARTVSANWALMTSASVKHFLFVAILVHWHHHTIRC